MRWTRRAFQSRGLTQYPPGPHLSAVAPKLKIRVTSVGRWDDIGQVLQGMGIEYEPFENNFDASILFANCGTPDSIDVTAVRAWVQDGGCLYASDLQASTVLSAFPEVFRSVGGINPGDMVADVADPEVAAVLGASVKLHFDTSGRVLTGLGGYTILRGAGDLPVMIEVPVGEGAVFFTSFHNHAQASEEERRLLEMLVLKQIGRSTGTTALAAGKVFGLGLLREYEVADPSIS